MLKRENWLNYQSFHANKVFSFIHSFIKPCISIITAKDITNNFSSEFLSAFNILLIWVKSSSHSVCFPPNSRSGEPLYRSLADHVVSFNWPSTDIQHFCTASSSTNLVIYEIFNFRFCHWRKNRWSSWCFLSLKLFFNFHRWTVTAI